MKVPFLHAHNIMTYKINNTVLIPLECIAYKKLENIPQGTNIYTDKNLPKSKVVKFSKNSMRKFRADEKMQTSKIQQSEKQSSGGFVENIKKSVSNFFFKLSVAWQL